MSNVYLERNLNVAKAVGIRANSLAALARLSKMKRPPLWMQEALEGIYNRSVDLPEELAKWRDISTIMENSDG